MFFPLLTPPDTPPPIPLLAKEARESGPSLFGGDFNHGDFHGTREEISNLFVENKEFFWEYLGELILQ